VVEERSIILRHDLTVQDLKSLLNYIVERVVKPRSNALRSLNINIEENRGIITFELEKPWDCNVEIEVNNITVNVKVKPLTRMGYEYSKVLIDSVVSSVREYDGMYGKGTLYLVFTDSMEFKGMRGLGVKSKMVSKMFSGTLTYLVVSFMIITILFIFFGMLAPIILTTLYLMVLLFSDKLLLKISDWKISEDNKHVHILEIKISRAKYSSFIGKVIPKIRAIKSEIYKRAIEGKGTFKVEKAIEVLKENDVDLENSYIAVKTINVNDIVKRVAEKYNIKKPKVGIVNTIIPNAAAVGIDPKLSSIIVTSGLLALLDEKEVESVIAHELSHISNRDPFILSAIAISEYLTRMYILYPMFKTLWETIPIIALGYVGLALFMILTLARFAEARCDIEAAMVVGDSKPLASALRKIGWRKLLAEIRGKGRAWLKIDPHPPLYFRVERLERFNVKNIKPKDHLYLRSVRECLSEMFKVIASR